MADPITWRNVAPTIRGPSVRDLAGNNGIKDSLDAIGAVIQQQQAIDSKNFAVGKDNNTQAYLDKVAGATVEQLSDRDFVANLQASASAQGQSIDQNKIRGAVGKQLSDLQNQSATAKAYNDQKAMEAAAPVLDNALNLAMAGDRKGVNDVITQLKLPPEQEAKLANQFNSIVGDYENRQRADRTEARVAAAQAESIAASRESRAFTALQRQDLLEGREQQRLGAEAAYRTVEDMDNANKASQDILKSIGFENNLPVGANGLPDESKMSPEQKTLYTDKVKTSGVTANLSATDGRKRLAQTLKANGADARALDAALKTFDLANSLNDLAPEDRKRIEGEQAAVETQIDGLIEARTTQYKAATDSNPFVKPDPKPLDSVNEILGTLVKNKFGTASDRQDVANMMTDWATNGIKLPDGSTRIVPTALMKQAVQSTDGIFFDDDSDVRDRVIDLMTSEGMMKAAKEAPLLREQFTNDLNKLQNEKINSRAKVAQRIQGGNMTPSVTNTILDDVLKRR